jgi:chaperonin GroES
LSANSCPRLSARWVSAAESSAKSLYFQDFTRSDQNEAASLHDRIIVKRLEEERKSAGGIVIPDTAAEKPSMGEVVAAGPGKTDDNGKLVASGVKVGDKILFGKYSGQEFKLEGQDLLHMREDDVIGIVA